jgi:hypothetical protein
MSSNNVTRSLFAAVQAFLTELYPGEAAEAITIRFADPRRRGITLPVPLALPAREPEEKPFIPSVPQRAILEALEGRAYRTDALSAKARLPRSQIFRKPKGGLAELQEQGLVEHHDRVGYYRPDAPPPELADILNAVDPSNGTDKRST